MYFDVTMPLTLFTVTVAAMLLSGKVERKLKSAVEEKEFKTRDTVLLVAAMSVTISLVVFIPQIAIMALFLFAYSLLLFVFTYVFSGFSQRKNAVVSACLFAVTMVAAVVSFFSFGLRNTSIYGTIAFLCLGGFTLVAAVDQKTAETGERWVLAVLPPAIFVGLYFFFSATPLWFPFLLNMYGLIFALMIIMYLGTLFTWKTTLIFATLLTIMDIILVLFTGTMVSAARAVTALRLPVLVSLPTLPAILVQRGWLYMSLGLGDFFFAGLLATQSYKKFGRNTAVLSTIGGCISFFVFETFMLNYEWSAFPGTLMIVVGWIPFVAAKLIMQRSKRADAATPS